MEETKQHINLGPFCEEPAWQGSWFTEADSENQSKKFLVVSGPSRNGNHLVHSLLDGVPEIPRVPGEDSFLNAIFQRLVGNYEAFVELLMGSDRAHVLLNLSESGNSNKWLEHHKGSSKSAEWAGIWAGAFRSQGREGFIYDYQDTLPAIDYPTFADSVTSLLKSPKLSLVDVIERYLTCLPHLDPEFFSRKTLHRYDGMLVSSGSRCELRWLLCRQVNLKVIVPLRRFDSFYFSFVKGTYGTVQQDSHLVREALDHWIHKIVDYLRLKSSFPGQVLLTSFDDIVEKPEAALAKWCSFLGVSQPHQGQLVASVLGSPVKGNSSFGKTEQHRGKIYVANAELRVDPMLIPSVVYELWAEANELFD